MTNERHATWLELFFDLVVVAAAIQVSHRLDDATSLGQVAACARPCSTRSGVWRCGSWLTAMG